VFGRTDAFFKTVRTKSHCDLLPTPRNGFINCTGEEERGHRKVFIFFLDLKIISKTTRKLHKCLRSRARKVRAAHPTDVRPSMNIKKLLEFQDLKIFENSIEESALNALLLVKKASK